MTPFQEIVTKVTGFEVQPDVALKLALEMKNAFYGPDRAPAHPLLDHLRGVLNAKNDAALSDVLQVPRPIISRIRHRKHSVSSTTLIRIHELTGMTFPEMRKMLGEESAA